MQNNNVIDLTNDRPWHHRFERKIEKAKRRYPHVGKRLRLDLETKRGYATGRLRPKIHKRPRDKKPSKGLKDRAFDQANFERWVEKRCNEGRFAVTLQDIRDKLANFPATITPENNDYFLYVQERNRLEHKYRNYLGKKERQSKLQQQRGMRDVRLSWVLDEPECHGRLDTLVTDLNFLDWDTLPFKKMQDLEPLLQVHFEDSFDAHLPHGFEVYYSIVGCGNQYRGVVRNGRDWQALIKNGTKHFFISLATCSYSSDEEGESSYETSDDEEEIEIIV